MNDFLAALPWAVGAMVVGVSVVGLFFYLAAFVESQMDRKQEREFVVLRDFLKEEEKK